MSAIRSFRVVAAMTFTGFLISCGGSSMTSDSTTNTSGNASVQALASLAFSPSSIAIRPGETVTWVFGSVGHTVTFDAVAGVPADIPGPTLNASVSRTFASAGTFTYHCSIHPSMTGTVIVSENSVTPPPPPPPPPSNPYGSVRP